MKLFKFKKGFTLIEILLVVSILSVLLVVVFAALNPAQRLADARNSRRWNDVNQILSALHQCIIDTDLATCGLTANGNTYQIGSAVSGCNTACATAQAACLDLDGDVDLDDYIASFPLDPSGGVAATTEYSVTVAANGILTVAACSAENGDVISVAR